MKKQTLVKLTDLHSGRPIFFNPHHVTTVHTQEESVYKDGSPFPIGKRPVTVVHVFASPSSIMQNTLCFKVEGTTEEVANALNLAHA